MMKENVVNSQSSFQISHDCKFYMEAQLIRSGLVFWFTLGDSQYTQNFNASVFSLYMNTAYTDFLNVTSIKSSTCAIFLESK